MGQGHFKVTWGVAWINTQLLENEIKEATGYAAKAVGLTLIERETRRLRFATVGPREYADCNT